MSVVGGTRKKSGWNGKTIIQLLERLSKTEKQTEKVGDSQNRFGGSNRKVCNVYVCVGGGYGRE